MLGFAHSKTTEQFIFTFQYIVILQQGVTILAECPARRIGYFVSRAAIACIC